MPDALAENEAYATLERRFRRMGLLGQAQAVLHWDYAAMMPPGGATARSDQLAELGALTHSLLTAPETHDLIQGALDRDDALDDWQRANVAEMKRQLDRAAALDEDFVITIAKARSACEQAWREARQEKDFKRVLPSFEPLIDLVREEAGRVGEALGLDPLDALMDAYEPGGRQADIDPVFADLEAFLPGFLADVIERQKSHGPVETPPGPFDIETQQRLGHRFMEILGFDFDHGRLDVSHHPFCGGIPDDVRITTRYDENDFTSALMGVLHETGHALYEQGLPQDWRLQPVGTALGMSMHESQSLLMEMQVCRSAPFLSFAVPMMREAFGGSGPAWDAGNMIRLYHRVQRSHIRVDADEVSYPLHVILRYGLEKAIIAGDLEAADVPGAWNERFERLMGIQVPDDSLGCLQDIHWYDGAIGYFPTYTLGAMTAAQIYHAARDRNAAIEPGIAEGDFGPLLSWLREHVHGHGRSMKASDLLTQATGKPLDAEAFKVHLRERYLEGV